MLCVSCKRVVIAYGKIFSELSILTHTKGNDCTADDCPPLLIFWCNTSYQQVVGQCFSLFPISSKNSFLCYIFNTIGLISFFFSPQSFCHQDGLLTVFLKRKMFTALARPGSEGLLSEADERVNTDMCIVSIPNCMLHHVVLANIHTLAFCDNLWSLDVCISKFQKCINIFLSTYQSGIRHMVEECTRQITDHTIPPSRASGANQKIQSWKQNDCN